MSDFDVFEQVIRFGVCSTCGAPRDAVHIETTMLCDPEPTYLVQLVCTADASHVHD